MKNFNETTHSRSRINMARQILAKVADRFACQLAFGRPIAASSCVNSCIRTDENGGEREIVCAVGALLTPSERSDFAKCAVGSLSPDVIGRIHNEIRGHLDLRFLDVHADTRVAFIEFLRALQTHHDCSGKPLNPRWESDGMGADSECFERERVQLFVYSLRRVIDALGLEEYHQTFNRVDGDFGVEAGIRMDEIVKRANEFAELR